MYVASEIHDEASDAQYVYPNRWVMSGLSVIVFSASWDKISSPFFVDSLGICSVATLFPSDSGGLEACLFCWSRWETHVECL